MNKRREFLLASGAIVSAIAAPTVATQASAATNQEGMKKFKITLSYIPGLTSVNDVLHGGGDKKEKEIFVIVEAENVEQAEYAFEWDNNGFTKVKGKNEVVAVAKNSITKYTITPA